MNRQTDGVWCITQKDFTIATGCETSSNGPLMLLPVDGRPSTQLVRCAMMGSLSVDASGTYYASCGRGFLGNITVNALTLDSGAIAVLAVLDHPSGHGVAVSPDRKRVLYSRQHRGIGVDVFLIDHFR